MATVLEQFSITPVAPWTSRNVTAKDNPCPSLLYGLELEIENLHDEEYRWLQGSMRMTEDGSLRNGMEFVLQPMTYSHVELVLRDFYQRNRINNNNYSERCSIHVHTNVQNLTFEQLASVCLIYQVFERVLFRWIGNERDRNIFCVPWYDTGNMTHRIVNRIKDGDTWITGDWLKYTALNLIPISPQGTIEWRHMHGHCDVDQIMQWLRFIGHIYRIAISMSFDAVKNMFVYLNTTSQYLDAINSVFGDDAAALKLPGYEIDLEDGVLHMKYSILQESVVGKERPPKDAPQAAPFPDPVWAMPQAPTAVDTDAIQNLLDRFENNRRNRDQVFFAAVDTSSIQGVHYRTVVHDDVVYMSPTNETESA